MRAEDNFTIIVSTKHIEVSLKAKCNIYWHFTQAI